MYKTVSRPYRKTVSSTAAVWKGYGQVYRDALAAHPLLVVFSAPMVLPVSVGAMLLLTCITLPADLLR